MKDRRSLVEAITPPTGVDASLEKKFVFGPDTKSVPLAPAAPPTPAAEGREGKGQSTTSIGREPLTTRIRTDYSKALKRASLERQLEAITPNTIQDILEEALEPWLRSNGYLS